MEQEENPQQAPPLPVLPRLDRLDRLVQLLEEKHGNSGTHLSNNHVLKKTEQEEKQQQEEDHRKSLTSALDEVHHKGTLMDRLAMLENRVLQLSLEMEEGNTSRSRSRSSSSTVQVTKTHGHDLIVSKGSTHVDDDQVAFAHHADKKQPPTSVQDLKCIQNQEKPSDAECVTTTLTDHDRSGGKREKRKGYSKWSGLFRCGGKERI